MLILPQEEWDATELYYVLRHEMTHVRRKDILYKTLLLLANGIHWFNPAAWLLRFRASQDLEISCDMLIMEGAPEEVRRRYCETILSAAQRSTMRGLGTSTTFGSTKRSIMERFREIFDERRRKKGIPVLIFVVLMVLLCGGVVIQSEENAYTKDPQKPSSSEVSSDSRVNGQAIAGSLSGEEEGEANQNLIANDDPSEQDLFYQIFWELDRDSMDAYIADNPEALQDGWSGIHINEAGLDDAGTPIKTIYGDQMLAINAADGIVLLRFNIDTSRGVLAIGKDTSRLSLCPAKTLGDVGQTAGEICEQNGGILAMTGSAFLDDGNGDGGQLSGTAVCSGEVLAGAAPLNVIGDKRIEVRNDNRMYIVDTTDPIGTTVRDAAEFHPALIVDSKIVVDENCGWTSPNPRAVIGQSDKLETMMLVMEGRLLDSPGCGVVEIAEKLQQYGCAQALNLDGGTSAILYYDGEYVTRCSNTDLPGGRRLPTAWVYH